MKKNSRYGFSKRNSSRGGSRYISKKADIKRNDINDDSQELHSFSNSSKNIKSNEYYSGDKTLRQIIKAEKAKQKEISKNNRKRFALIRWCMILTISVIVAGFFMVGAKDMLAIDRNVDSKVAVSIPKNASKSEVARILKNAGAINEEGFFLTYISLFENSTSFSNGEYELKTNMEYGEIINYINTQNNRLDTVDVTFAEGLTVQDCAQLLEEKNVCNKDEFLEACKSSEFDEKYTFLKNISNAGDRYYKLEGYLYPDTYTFYNSVEPNTVIKKLLSNFENKVIGKHNITGYDEKTSYEEIAKKKDISLDKLISLASMVQAEAANEDDMKVIAGIFWNRLKSDDVAYAHLNSDPTKYYPYKSLDQMPTGFKSSYDTYDVVGLPAGPIRNPGEVAINAVLNPEKTKYMYFCHDKETGKPYYASTQREHNQNLKKAGLA